MRRTSHSRSTLPNRPLNFSRTVACLFLLIAFTSLPTHGTTITTLSLSTSRQWDLLANKSYRNFFLRQYFIDLLNASHSSLVQSMISHHYLNVQLEQIQSRRRRSLPHFTLPLVPTSTLHSTHCAFNSTTGEVHSTLPWSHAIEPFASIELIYHIDEIKRHDFAIPVRIRFKQPFTSVELLTVDTHVQYDAIREFYFLNIHPYLNRLNTESVDIETTIHNRTCQASHAYLILSSPKARPTPVEARPSTSACTIRTIPVRFHELGLASFIIRPQEYLFTYCDGSCAAAAPSPLHSRSSMYTLLQSLVRRNHPTTIPAAKCVASEYADDSFLLRQADGTLEIYPIKNVIVKQCVCL